MQHMTPVNYSAKVIHGEYYPHIDGIRAFAVLPVVLFHVLACLCPGGFAGVDVFFVISGYLITGGILRDLEKDRFAIRNFYHRRIKRIMPAYFALIAGVFAAGCALYYAQPLIFLGDAVSAGTLFLANFHFWMLGGDYFAPQLHSQALLHLWSLSVEEQFYLFIPILCAIIWKLRRRWLLPAFAGIAILSFAGAVYAIATGKQNSAFYLLHFRAWELLAGSLLAMVVKQGSTVDSTNPVPSLTHSRTGTSPLPSPLTSHPLLAFLGLFMVLIPYIVMSSTTPFPGLAALSSVIGTALLIRYGNTGWISRLLGWRPFVATGKISYSLYLWHWPVTVFWKYAVYDQLYWYDYAGMFLLSFLLAAFSWRFVEVPVRASPAWTMRRSFAFALTGIVLLTSIGLACIFSNGWPTILHPKANSVSSVNEFQSRAVRMLITAEKRVAQLAGKKVDDPFRLSFGAQGDFHLGAVNKKAEILLVGDSHAGALQHGFDIVLRENGRGGYAINRSNTNMFNVQSPDCQYVLNELAKRPSITKVVLASCWKGHASRSRSANAPSLQAQIKEFAACVKAMGKTLYVLTDVPFRDYSPCEMAARTKIIPPRQMYSHWQDGIQAETELEQKQGEINRNLARACQKTGAMLIPLHHAFKRDNHYIAFDKQNDKTIIFYRDTDHLSKAGSLSAARFIFPYLFPETVHLNQLQDKTNGQSIK